MLAAPFALPVGVVPFPFPAAVMTLSRFPRMKVISQNEQARGTTVGWGKGGGNAQLGEEFARGSSVADSGLVVEFPLIMNRIVSPV